MKTKSNPRGSGRKPAYKPEYAQIAAVMCEMGAIDLDLAKAFNTSRSTISLWKNKYPDFMAALTKGKEMADEKVKRSLFERATGYSHPEDKIFCDVKSGMTEIVPTTKHYPPDTTACIFWLKNRDSENWRDRQEHTGKDGEKLVPDSIKVIYE